MDSLLFCSWKQMKYLMKAAGIYDRTRYTSTGRMIEPIHACRYLKEVWVLIPDSRFSRWAHYLQ
jgi:hypothetical protein